MGTAQARLCPPYDLNSIVSPFTSLPELVASRRLLCNRQRRARLSKLRALQSMRANKFIYLALDVRGQEIGAHVFRRPTIVENWRFPSVGTDDKISGRSITSRS